MARGEESDDYKNAVESFASESSDNEESTKSKKYSASEERGWDGRRDEGDGEEEPNPYEIE